MNNYNQNIAHRILEIIERENLSYELFEHDAASTAVAAAKSRGSKLEEGGKTILFKNKNSFYLFVLSAAKQINSREVKRILKTQKYRFATTDELFEVCGVKKGALPPINKDIYELDLYLDRSILENEYIVFNIGILTSSVRIKVEDYLLLVVATYESFSK